MFGSDFSVEYAAKIPYAVVQEKFKFNKQSRAPIMHLRHDDLSVPRVRSNLALLLLGPKG